MRKLAVLLLLAFSLSTAMSTGASLSMAESHGGHDGHGAGQMAMDHAPGHCDGAACHDGAAAACCPSFTGGCQSSMARPDECVGPGPDALASAFFVGKASALRGTPPEAELPPPRV